ncbi:MAG: nucleotide sugar dehydrogenase [Planctomycetota bacterium]
MSPLPSPPPVPDPEIAARIEAGRATVAVVGLGYVGLPVAAAFVGAGLPVIGFDIDPAKIAALDGGEKYLPHVPDDEWRLLTDSSRFRASDDPEVFASADAVLICVPTPLRAGADERNPREPDLGFVAASARAIAAHLRPGALVVLESTTYPGTTRTLLGPLFEEAGLAPGRGVHLAYSPERTDPGRTDLPTVEIPKLVGGLDETSRDLAAALYRHAFTTVHPVRSAEVAESAKLLENVYRAVNIALVNEMKLILERMGIDVWEVIEAAATKPYGFEAFRPGPGLGGHCIPIDPFYLTWAAERVGFPTRFIELAGEINTAMPEHVVGKLGAALTDGGRELAGARVLILGVAYKRDVGDTRETPAAEIIERLRARGAEVAYHDPWIPRFPSMRRHSIELDSVPLTDDLLAASDATIIVTDHAAIDWEMVARHASLIVDTRNAMAGREVRGRVVKA